MKQYRVVAEVDGKVRVVGSPPYPAEATANRVRSLWFNMLRKQGIMAPYVRVQVTDVDWSEL